MTGSGAALAATAMLAACAAGCAPSRTATTVAPPPAAVVRSLAVTAAPDWRCREMTLPAGCSIADHTARLAVYKRGTGIEFPNAVLGLLDLRTGRCAEVVTMPVASAERYDVLGRALSDEWLAWEELSRDETLWRLYAAPIDAGTLTVGDPVLVDSGRSAVRGRPLFGVDGRRIVWTSPERLRGVPRAIVRARELPSGATAELHRGDRHMKAVRLAGDRIVLTTEERDSNASVVTVLDARTGRTLRESSLGNIGPVSHYADTDGTLTAWAAYESRDLPWPAVYVRDAVGTAKVAPLGCDPAVRDGRVLFEIYGVSGESGGIDGVDLAAGTRFTLIPLDERTSPSWQLCASATRPGGIAVAWQDEMASSPTDRDPVTRVRAWQTE